ncbi:alternate F1F0 ATPase, F1 subunit alpha [Desulfuromonas sp. AOP6]|uniref:alternate F1F0 ATPase, F1 subunit alpha n=1 Tax=Desulfuromonas sp. AOP6 TaxID=1566351 RepID=UPI001289309E|nr:alternate F1F0 ATPase, F1 subunit alpha [Desulfuromonas sp. AOP6]BCA79929.1 alternate F1F0 ATPase, F1 subunit alpha [Desulfuromonas sp. AOP6]
MPETTSSSLDTVIREALQALDQGLDGYTPALTPQVVGRVNSIGKGIARVSGLTEVRADELLAFPGNGLGLAFNINSREIGVVMLGEYQHLRSGDEVYGTGRVLDVPVGENLIGRVVDPNGKVRDDKGGLRYDERRPLERPAPAIMDRAPVTTPLMTGLKAIDALIPIGRGQRELILGDRQTGKTAITIDTIINQKDTGVLCFYCAIGQRASTVARVIADLEKHGAMEYTTVVTVKGDDPPGLKFIAPYAATTMAEYFMEKGKDVLVIYDDLTQHARAYRELSLLLRRPPGREAFPGDIFYIHSRLLERSTHLKEELGGGSLTALPIIETEAQNISAYIPTNLISITDGQIYLSPGLFSKGILPAIDIGKSVSRVGGKTQLQAYRAVAGDLRLSYSQFEELEAFSRFGTRLDEETRKTLDRGRRVRAVLKQSQYSPRTAAEQIIVLFAVNEGLFDAIPEEQIMAGEERLHTAVHQITDIAEKINAGKMLSEEDFKVMRQTAKEALAALEKE